MAKKILIQANSYVWIGLKSGVYFCLNKGQTVRLIEEKIDKNLPGYQEMIDRRDIVIKDLNPDKLSSIDFILD